MKNKPHKRTRRGSYYRALAEGYAMLNAPIADSLHLAAGPVPIANPKRLTVRGGSLIITAMGDFCRLIWCAVMGLCRSRSALQGWCRGVAARSRGITGRPVAERRPGKISDVGPIPATRD
jgi:hypothetical protein